VRFVKVEGAGNDYVLVDEFDQQIDDPAALSRVLSDRHQGIGSDGLLLVGPAVGDAVARMRIFNADGSEGLMCGNGLRCVVRYLVETGRARGEGAEIDILVETSSGVRLTRWFTSGAVEVHMGVPSFLPDAMPCDLPGDGRAPARHPLPPGLVGVADGAYAVSVGNPHLVLRVDDVAAFDLARHGTALQVSPHLGQGANVHAVQVEEDGRLLARPWERGSGATRACGTGAVAIAAVARAMGWALGCGDGDQVVIEMPGGSLGVRLEVDGSAWLSGPARLVFRGEWPIPAALS
jgi:diaminopimelate epimerase